LLTTLRKSARNMPSAKNGTSIGRVNDAIRCTEYKRVIEMNEELRELIKFAEYLKTINEMSLTD